MGNTNVDHLHSISLCSGGGGLDLGLSLAIPRLRTVCWVEWESFAVEVLASRMEAKQVAEAPVWSDLRTFDGKPWRGVVDIVTGGYPCQPFSISGKRLGSDDPRHLWPHIARIVDEVEPTVCFFENVPGHLSLGFNEVAKDLEAMDFTVAAGLFDAEEICSPQKRLRLFILAVANTYIIRSQNRLRPTAPLRPTDSVSSSSTTLGDTFPPAFDDDLAWGAIPEDQHPVYGLVDGLAPNHARLCRLFGNGVVPLQAAYAFCSLWSALRF